jgi:hypothetical protein
LVGGELLECGHHQAVLHGRNGRLLDIVSAGWPSVLQGQSGCFQAEVYLQLLLDVLDVRPDGVGADGELAADLGVAQAATQQLQHLPLSWR